MYEKLKICLIEDIERFNREICYIHEKVMLPTWQEQSGLHGLSNTLYGFMMGAFSRIDYFSQLWIGTKDDYKQADRMRDFMVQFMGYDKESSYVSVQIWRHKLMHTSKPRQWKNPKNGVIYKYLIQWGEEHLPKSKNFIIEKSSSIRILNIGLIFFIKDLSKGLNNYLNAVDISDNLKLNIDSVLENLKL